jgi:hypothetical protein
VADLLVWGHDRRWWALLTWPVTVNPGRGEVRCSAWCPSATVFQSGHLDARAYRTVLRLRLPADRAAWPAPWAYASTPTQHWAVITAPVRGVPRHTEFRATRGTGH